MEKRAKCELTEVSTSFAIQTNWEDFMSCVAL